MTTVNGTSLRPWYWHRIPPIVRALDTRERVLNFLSASGHPAMVRAAAESWLWLEHTSGSTLEGMHRKGIGCLARELGCSVYELEQRHRLHRGGPDAEVIWREVDAGMTIKTAVRLLQEAQAGDPRVPLRQHIERVVRAYHGSDTFVCRTGSGTLVRRRRRGGEPETARPPPVVDEEADGLDASASDGAEPRSVEPLVLQVRRIFRAHVAHAMPEAGGHDVNAVVVPALVELEEIIHALDTRLEAYRRKLRGEAAGAVAALVALSRRRIIAACQLLSMDPPPPGRPADLADARKRRGKLGAAYHQDRVGDDSMRDQYEAVMNAYRTLEEYNETLEAPRPTSVQRAGRTVQRAGREAAKSEAEDRSPKSEAEVSSPRGSGEKRGGSLIREERGGS